MRLTLALILLSFGLVSCESAIIQPQNELSNDSVAALVFHSLIVDVNVKDSTASGSSGTDVVNGELVHRDTVIGAISRCVFTDTLLFSEGFSIRGADTVKWSRSTSIDLKTSFTNYVIFDHADTALVLYRHSWFQDNSGNGILKQSSRYRGVKNIHCHLQPDGTMVGFSNPDSTQLEAVEFGEVSNYHASAADNGGSGSGLVNIIPTSDNFIKVLFKP